ncbi:MAG TPA: transporter, partial [Gammaproteobacteria bacterium]|nr:transporter [Gammaproteobacteria bacterium]
LFNYQASLAYGISDDLTVGVTIPYLERNNIRAAHNDMGMGEVEVAGDAAGIGDVRFFGQYRFYHDLQQDMAVIGGVKTPTGATGEREAEGELFETDHQPGSGSWDPFFGLAYNRSFGRAGFSANILYSFTTEGSQQTELGDAFNYNLALSYRLFSAAEANHHHHHDSHEHSHEQHAGSASMPDYIDIALELNGDVRGRDDIGGADEENSGGHILYLSPGIRTGFAKNWTFYTSAGIPVINDLNGEQGEPGYRVIGGFSVLF